MKKILIFIVILFGLGLIGWGGYYFWQGTPRYSLYQMGRAIKNHDSETFLLYLDIDQIVDELADSTFKEVEKKTSSDKSSEKSKKGRSSISRSDIVKNLMPQVIKSLKPILKRQIIKAVENVGRENRVSPLAFCALSKIERNGEFAEVTVKIKEKQTFQFTMDRTPSRLWKVVKIDMHVLDLL